MKISALNTKYVKRQILYFEMTSMRNVNKLLKMEITIPQISLDSDLADLIVELEKLRSKIIGGTTHPDVFHQVKNIFHTLESIGSARIEGNNTTIADYIETKITFS